MRESISAVVARNDLWEGVATSEPYEVAWASEAVIFLRNLGSTGTPELARAWVQISPDGLNWVDEGTLLEIPREGGLKSARIRGFGAFMRVMTVLPQGSSFKALLTFSLKE
ncbi:hypothetical protein [Mesorhizobium sp. Z1-4]|uniref:hypothetical protein n=1 Tax=Mesorhizobium sp. Z1-4 TaxID=2448478 RepID=UPI000FD7194B|nr:hypothetical protein [Mesorhizobium sp. Z1-4]